MISKVQTVTPDNSPIPIGPYSHIAKVGEQITIGGVGGVDPNTGIVAGNDVFSQVRQILLSFDVMLQSVGSNLEHVVHVHVFLLRMSDFDEMNQAYIEVMKTRRLARTVIGVCELPKPDFKVLMNLNAVAV